MVAALAAFEAKVRSYWHDLTGEARADLAKALEDVKAEQAKLAPVVQTAEADLKALVASAEPELKAAVESRAGKLVEEVMALLSAPTAM